MLPFGIMLIKVADDCRDFSGITSDSTRAVRLDQSNRRGRETGIFIGTSECFFLTFATRRVNALESTITR